MSACLDACSKQIHFGVMSPAEIVNTAEFHVYERALYKVGGARVAVLVGRPNDALQCAPGAGPHATNAP